jgi:hypothetical protein
MKGVVAPIASTFDALTCSFSMLPNNEDSLGRLQRRKMLDKVLSHTFALLCFAFAYCFLEIYAPFQKLSKDSLQYAELARSGAVWRDYFQPFTITQADFGMFMSHCLPFIYKPTTDFNKKNERTLEYITKLKTVHPPDASKLSDLFKLQLSHQSAAIEGYKLQQGH